MCMRIWDIYISVYVCMHWCTICTYMHAYLSLHMGPMLFWPPLVQVMVPRVMAYYLGTWTNFDLTSPRSPRKYLYTFYMEIHQTLFPGVRQWVKSIIQENDPWKDEGKLCAYWQGNSVCDDIHVEKRCYHIGETFCTTHDHSKFEGSL